MIRRRHQRGATLVELMVGVFVLGLATVVATTLFPLSSVLRDKSGDYSRASAITNRKLEQIRSLRADQLNLAGLKTAGIVDATNTATAHGNPSAPRALDAIPAWTFTTTDQIDQELVNATGVVQLSGVGTDLVRADVTVSWLGLRSVRYRVSGVTMVTSKEVWREP